MTVIDEQIHNTSPAAGDDDAEVDNTRSESVTAEEVVAQPPKAPRKVSVTLRTAIVAVVICLLAGGAGIAVEVVE